MPSNVMVVVGTRPEAIKMAPLVQALEQQPDMTLHLCVTGQHQAMLQPVLDLFALEATSNLNVMREGQTLNALVQALVSRLDHAYQRIQPDIVLVHGDTATCFAATLAAFHRHLPVAHVEAGLRTGNRHSPRPEEAYRRMTACLADLHFAPTPLARDNLLREGVPAGTIDVTGNTVVDALLWVRRHLQQLDWRPGAETPLHALREDARVVLITGHRRENVGQGLQNICRAIGQLAERYPDIDFVYPVHLNPRVSDTVHAMLGDTANILLTEPLDYHCFVWLMDRATLILTDSGGIQEEAPGLDTPVLVMRDNTERPEAVDAGTVRLVGNQTGRIVDETIRLLESPSTWRRMRRAPNPYGDGRACQRIVRRLDQWLSSAAGS